MEAASKRAYVSRKAILSVASAKQKLLAKKQKKRSSMKAKSSSDEDLSDAEYAENNRSCEMIDSDELEGELNLSECEEADEVLNVRQEAKKKRKNKGRKFRQEVDTNIFKIAFSTLKQNAEIATGDPYFCKGCQAVMNKFSTVVDVDENLQMWKCEFCNSDNEV